MQIIFFCPQKLLRYTKFCFSPIAAQTAQTEEFIFQNVAYKATVYRTGWFTNLQGAPFEFEGGCNKSGFRIPDFFDHGYTPRNFEFFQLVFFAMCLKFTENSICQIFVRALGFKIQTGFVKFFCQFS